MTKSYFMNAGEPRTYTEEEAQARIDAAVAAALAAANAQAAASDAMKPRLSLADRLRAQLKRDAAAPKVTEALNRRQLDELRAQGHASSDARPSLADRAREQMKLGMQ